MNPDTWRTILWIVLIPVGIYVAYGLVLFLLQASMVYYPIPGLVATPDQAGMDYEAVSFKASDGTELFGWFVPVEDARAVVLFFHGNAGNISHRLESMQIFQRLGLSVFIFDYRGYGQSRGSPTEKGTYLDAEAAWEYLVQERGINPSQIVLFGRSLGGAVAAWLAQDHKAGALILESTFTSVPDLAANLYPFYPVRLLARFRYNAEDYVTTADCPVLVIHSPDDELIPFSHGQNLFKAAKEPKVFLEISGTHNEGFITSGKHYRDGLDTFLSRHVEP